MGGAGGGAVDTVVFGIDGEQFLDCGWISKAEATVFAHVDRTGILRMTPRIST